MREALSTILPVALTAATGFALAWGLVLGAFAIID